MQSTCWIYISICGDFWILPSIIWKWIQFYLLVQKSNWRQNLATCQWSFSKFWIWDLSSGSLKYSNFLIQVDIKQQKKPYYAISLTFRIKEWDVPIIILMKQVPHRTRYLNTWLPVLDPKDGKSWSLRDNLKGLFFLCVVCMWYYLSMFLLQPLAAPSLQPLLQAFLQEP